MGRYKDLKEKQVAGTLTEDEKAELDALIKDFEEDNDSDDKAVDELASKIADKAKSQIDERLDEVIKKLEKVEVPPIEVKEQSRVIIDSELGEVPVKKLEETTVEIADRKQRGKKIVTVSKKSIHFVQAMIQQDRQKLQILTEGTAASGGYLVPEEFANMIVEDRRDATIMRQLGTVIPVTTDTFHLPTLATRPKTFWRAEAAVKNTSTAQFGEIVLTPYSLASIVPLSNELVADASLGTGGSIVSLVAGLMAQAIAEEEDKAFWTGNGSAKPTGIDNYTFTTVDAGAGASDSARADAITKAIYRLPQGYRAGAVAVANKNTWSKIATLKNSQNDYLLTSLANSPSPTLRGLPTYEQNDIGDGKLFVGDFKNYFIADRQGVTVDVSTEATVGGSSAFEKNLTFVRVEERVDGELALTDGIVEVVNLGGL